MRSGSSAAKMKMFVLAVICVVLSYFTGFYGCAVLVLIYGCFDDIYGACFMALVVITMEGGYVWCVNMCEFYDNMPIL